MRRPVVGSALAVGMLATVGATMATGEPSHEGETAAVSAPSTSAPAFDAAGAVSAQVDTARLDAGRRDANTSRSASREKDRAAARARLERRQEWRAAQDKIAAREKAATTKKATTADRKKERAAQAKQRDWVAAVQRDPKPYAVEILREHGFGDDQWGCLETLWTGESDWTWDATNSSSGAYGIPQSLPADKMATAGSDWKTNPITQMEWGIGYIQDAYGSPCQALEFWNSKDPHWY